MTEDLRVQLRVESLAVKRSLYVYCSTVIFEMCDSVRLLRVPVLKSVTRKRIVEIVINLISLFCTLSHSPHYRNRVCARILNCSNLCPFTSYPH
jgi:hypothetical protein